MIGSEDIKSEKDVCVYKKDKKDKIEQITISFILRLSLLLALTTQETTLQVILLSLSKMNVLTRSCKTVVLSRKSKSILLVLVRPIICKIEQEGLASTCKINQDHMLARYCKNEQDHDCERLSIIYS